MSRVVPGSLFVFEGPDGVGKSELSRQFVTRLRKAGAECEYLAFPGRRKGTLGQLVYDLHHDPAIFGIEAPWPASLQVLHVAAHIEAIQSTIMPALREGRSVVLDRFWWSTYVYGRTAGLSASFLDHLVRVELGVWADSQPTRGLRPR